MEVIIQIETCLDCRHNDHTGAFTPGGAKPCCHHPETVKQNDGNYKVIPYKQEWTDHRNVFHKHTFNIASKPIRTPKGIPTWCPLKNGKKY